MNKKLNIKDPGFKVPKDYFNTLEDKVLDKLKSKDGIDGTAPCGFTVPDGYFETVEDKVLKTIATQDNKVISLFSGKRLLYISGVAATIVVLFGIFMTRDVQSDPVLDAEMAEVYLLQQDLSTYELASLLTEEDIESLSTEIMTEAFNNDEMEDYLIEHVDVEDIIEQ